MNITVWAVMENRTAYFEKSRIRILLYNLFEFTENTIPVKVDVIPIIK